MATRSESESERRDPDISMKVYGRLACFTRPEFGVERVSYDVITPSAARGVIESVFWKPEIAYRIRRVKVLAPIRRIRFALNEVESKPRALKATAAGERYFADQDRSQRQTLALKDVCYIIEADILRMPWCRAPAPKYTAQIRRRLANGQCFRQPFMGMEDFPAYFEAPDGSEEPANLDEELGPMLLDLAYESPRRAHAVRRAADTESESVEPSSKELARYERTPIVVHDATENTAGGFERASAEILGAARAHFFDARLEAGVMEVPDKAYEDLFAGGRPMTPADA